MLVFVSFRSDADLRHAASRLRLRWVVCFVQVCSRRSSKQPNQPLLLPPTTLPNRPRNRYNKPKQTLISTTTQIAAAALLKTPMVIISWLTTLKKSSLNVSVCVWKIWKMGLNESTTCSSSGSRKQVRSVRSHSNSISNSNSLG